MSCTVFEILTFICAKKLRRHVILTTPIWGKFVVTRQTLLGPIRAQNLTILYSSIPEILKGGVNF